MTTPKRYTGNEPRSVRRAAKYRVAREDGEWVVELQFVLNDREYALLTTTDHDELVDMVNEVKLAVNGTAGGSFYLNEYGQVLVPSTVPEYFVGGEYHELLEFDFDGDVISAEAPATLEPGDEWEGPHVGIPYTLAANGKDIRYEARYGRIRETRLLSDYVGVDPAAQLARRLAAFRPEGGRVYINECREFFSRLDEGGTWRTICLGPLGEDPWFPRPE